MKNRKAFLLLFVLSCIFLFCLIFKKKNAEVILRHTFQECEEEDAGPASPELTVTVRRIQKIEETSTFQEKQSDRKSDYGYQIQWEWSDCPVYAGEDGLYVKWDVRREEENLRIAVDECDLSVLYTDGSARLGSKSDVIYDNVHHTVLLAFPMKEGTAWAESGTLEVFFSTAVSAAPEDEVVFEVSYIHQKSGENWFIDGGPGGVHGYTSSDRISCDLFTLSSDQTAKTTSH